jgi:type IV pilus assembly protein PilE
MKKKENTFIFSGFTLIELLVVIVIVGIITFVAIGSFGSYGLAGKRADGVNAILAISLAEERYRSSNTTYGSLAQAYNGVSASPQGFYTLSISNTSATGYTITATAQGTQANDAVGSTSCTALQFVMNNGTITKTPAVCWPS